MGYGLVFVILQRCPLGDSHSFAAEVADDLRGVLLLSLAFMEWEPLTAPSRRLLQLVQNVDPRPPKVKSSSK